MALRVMNRLPLKRSLSSITVFFKMSPGVSVGEDQERLPTFYWLPKLHKQPYNVRFIANSSSCTTTEISKLLTLVLLLSKIMLLNIVKKSMKGPVKIFFGQSKIHVRY